MTAIALVGTTSAMDRTRRRLSESRLPFHVVDDVTLADLVVTDDPAPTPNHLGVASADLPDHFFCRDESVDYVVAALTEAHLAGAHGVRVRRTVQDNPDLPVLGLHLPWHRWARKLADCHRFRAVDYDWTTDESIDVEAFDGAVIVQAAAEEFTARIRARGAVDANDGRFHWGGMLYSDRAAELKADGKSSVTVRINAGEPVMAKLAEVTQWGTVRMTGVGTPPWEAAAAAR